MFRTSTFQRHEPPPDFNDREIEVKDHHFRQPSSPLTIQAASFEASFPSPPVLPPPEVKETPHVKGPFTLGKPRDRDSLSMLNIL